MPRSANPLRKDAEREPKPKKTPEQRTRNSELSPRDTEVRLPWVREDFMRDLYKASARVVAEIEANPDEVKRLEKSRRDIEEGRDRWEDQEDDAGEA